MILILSSETDLSTDNVTDWLDSFSGDYIRVGAKEILGNISNHYIGDTDLVYFGNNRIEISKVRVIWNRRWSINENVREVKTSDEINNKKINSNIYSENKLLNEYIMSLFPHSKWIDPPSVSDINKLKQLTIAKKIGLNIPDTIITTLKDDVVKFKNKHSKIICKAIQSFLSIKLGEDIYASYTSSIEEEDFKKMPDKFFPSLFQSRIDKDVEIRTVYLDSHFYSMAIFSQHDEQTESDYRKYNKSKPNRNIPFKLPTSVERKLSDFMKSVGLSTGSLDIIKSKGGKYVFLEVNPVGQYDMTGQPCNYELDKIFAEWLIKIDNE